MQIAEEKYPVICSFVIGTNINGFETQICATTREIHIRHIAC